MTEINNEINIEEFNETPVIKKLRQKQRPKKTEVIDAVVVNETNEENGLSALSSEGAKPKQTRGRKRKYNTEEERIQARRIQQKAYRERKKKELEELKKKVEVMNE